MRIWGGMCSDESIKEQWQDFLHLVPASLLGAHSFGDLFLLQHHPRIILFQTQRTLADVYLLEQSGLNAVTMWRESADLALPQHLDNSILPNKRVFNCNLQYLLLYPSKTGQ